jgi:hypothetical protein
MKPAYPYSIIALLIFVFLVIAPAAAYSASPLDSGVSRGDYDTLKIFEAKDTFKKSESSQYVTPWVGIVPGSQLIKACNKYADFRYRLITPDGKNYDQVVSDPTGKYMYKNADGAVLSANGFFFTNDNKAAKWLKVSNLVNNAAKQGYSWQGTWTIDYYFGNFDCNNVGSYDKIKTLTFTLVDDSAPSATPIQHATEEMTHETQSSATQAPITQQPAVSVTHQTEQVTQAPVSVTHPPPPQPTPASGLETVIVIGAIGLAVLCLSGRKD